MIIIQCGRGNVGRVLRCCGQFIVKVFSAIYRQNPQSSWSNVLAGKYQFSTVLHFTCFSLNLTSHPPLHNFFIDTRDECDSPGTTCASFASFGTDGIRNWHVCVLLSVVPFGISISIGCFAGWTSSIGAPGKIKCPVVPVSAMALLRFGLFVTLVILFIKFISTFSCILFAYLVLFLSQFDDIIVSSSAQSVVLFLVGSGEDSSYSSHRIL